MGFNSAFKGLNPIGHLLALLGAHLILHVSRIRIKTIQGVVCVLLGISPASDFDLPTFRKPQSVNTLHPAVEDGTERGLPNVGKSQSGAWEIPKRTHTIFKTR
jgi:hypothetical protein